MAWRERHKRAAGEGLDVRLHAADRIGGPFRPESPAPRRERAARPSRKSRRGTKRWLRIGRLFYWGMVLALWALIAAAGFVVWVGMHLPPIQSLEIPKRPPSVLILGGDGATLTTRGELPGTAVPLSELPAYVPNAFIAIEDRRFYEHGAIDPWGIVRAGLADILHRRAAQGASTITQQLARNLFLTQERTLTRKVQELLLAFWLEHKFGKKQILELYLNRVYFGTGAYGVEEAAQLYFGKSARRLTLAEAAMLAGLVKAPSRLAPSRNPQGAERRARLVLEAMAELKVITPGAAKLALLHPARAVKPPPDTGSIKYVADWVMDAVDDLIGNFDTDIVVETTIVPALQNAAEHALDDELAQRGDKLGVSQGALVAMTPDGAVRALVGGKNYAESQFNRAIAAKRQPGSTFKPFVYLTALEGGLTPDTVRDDAPLNVNGWRPEDYKRRYLGPVTLTAALADSLNTVAVRLALEFGPAAIIRTAYRLGIVSKLTPNASIALGTSDVSLYELVSAYAPFANGGFAASPHVIERVRTADGKVLYARSPQPLSRVVDARYVAMLNAMMRETLLSGTARNARLPGWQAAGKTGTSQDYRDAWFIGYTSNLVAGIWLGNDDDSPTHRVAGGGLPVEIWSRFMRAAHKGLAPAPLPGLAPWYPSPVAAAPFSAPPPASTSISPPPPAGEGREGPSPVPPAAIPSAASAPAGAHANNKSGLDFWLIDRLFGQR